MDAHERKRWTLGALIAACVAAGVVVSVLAIGRLAQVLLLFFAGIVLAAFLRAVSSWTVRRTGAPMGLALACTVVVLLGIAAASGALLVPHVIEQLGQLSSQLGALRRSAAQLLGQHEWLRQLWDRASSQQSHLVSRALGLFSTAAGALGGLAVIVFVGLYLASTPETYLSGALRLVPVTARQRARSVAGEVGSTLQRWVLGRILSCTIVGVGTTLGLWAIGAQLAISLGVIAGILSFVPNIGPLLSVVPAIAVNLPNGIGQIALVCAVYAAVQTLESFLITPQIQKRAVRVPPVLLLFGQTAMGALTGVLGVLLATPLLACVLVVVQRLYVQGTLEQDEPRRRGTERAAAARNEHA